MKEKRRMGTVIFVVVMILASAAFFGGYTCIQYLYAVPEQVTEFLGEYKAENTNGNPEAADKENRTAAVTRFDLLYFEDADIGAVIRVIDGRTHALHYFTIPADTYIELSEQEYQELSARYPAIPQIFRLSVLQSYMECAEAVQVLAMSLETKLACRFSECTAIKWEQAEGWLSLADGVVMPGEKLDAYLKEEKAQRDAFGLLKTWEDASGKTQTDIFLYAETIAFLEERRCVSELIGGRRSNGGYRMDYEYARRQLWGQ